MDRLTKLALGFGLSCALCVSLLPVERIWILSAGSLGLLLLASLRGGKRRRSAVLFLLGVSAGGLWFWGYHSLYLSDALRMDGKTAEGVVSIRDYGEETAYGTTGEGTVHLEGKAYHVKVYLKDQEAVKPGDTLTGTFRFRVTIPGGSRPDTYHKGRGTFLLLYQTGELVRRQDPNRSLTQWAAELRHTLQEILCTCFPEDTSGFARALLLGDTAGLGYELDTALKSSGIRHVAAVSGLHVSILFALVCTVTRRRRFLTAMVGLPVIGLFAALTGFSPSASRACLMCGLMLVGMAMGRTYDKRAALAFAALLMMLMNPMVITDVGFQLSVGSVAGIFLFSGKLGNWIQERFGLPHWVAGSLSVTLGAMVFTTPLCAVYFGMVSLVGVVTNLLTLWAIGGIFYGVLTVCGLFAFWEGGAVMLAQGISLLIRYVQWVAKGLARLPLAAVYTKSPYIALWLVFVYVLLGFFCLRGKKNPGRLITWAAVGLCAAVLISVLEPLRDDVRFTVLDVGQGQCLLVQSEGYTFLVDCGGDGQSADIGAEALLSQGITRLDGLILTHEDRDHTGGVAGLLSRVDTELLILPDRCSDLGATTKGEVIYAKEELEIAFGSGRIRIYPAKYPGSSNEMSLCVLFDTQKCDILITGDRNGFGERSLLRNGDIPKVDILVAGHHGSKNSTCQELLSAVQPEIVCISVGRDNAYGHPDPELLTRLEENGCQVCRTDLSGDIVIRR